jgi:peptide/nickel transport system substrate-binding protein
MQKDQFDHLNPLLVDHSQARAVVNNIRSTLLRLNEDAEIVGDVASDWTYEGTSLTFDIRENVVFHNGDQLTAEDIVFSIETLQGMDASPIVGQTSPIQSVEAPDDTTVQMELKQPNAAILAFLTTEGGVSSTISKTALEEMGEDEYDRFPVSTGPYKITDRQQGVSLTLEKNDDYFEEDKNGTQLPYLDQITINLIPEPSTAWSALNSGEVQYVETLPPEIASQAEEVGDIDVFPIHAGRWFSYYMLCNDPADHPEAAEIAGGPGEYDDIWSGQQIHTSDKRVRDALAKAIDREELVKRAYQGWAKPAHSLWNPDLQWLYEEEPEPGQYYDPEEAERLLDEVGLTGDPRLTIEAPALPERERELTILEQQFADIGVELKPVVLDPGSFWGRIYNFKDQFAGYLGTRDFDPYFSSYRQLNAPRMDDGVAKGIWNRGLFINEEFSSLMEESLQATDQESRKEAYEQAMEIFHEEVPMAMTVFPSTPRAKASNLKGVGMQAGLSNFHRAYLE